ncbi:MAG: hypothetical protein H6673_03305 [Anaerolineales bacterium]|nr:hypothetical protein [Anaerolineales bacterium]
MRRIFIISLACLGMMVSVVWAGSSITSPNHATQQGFVPTSTYLPIPSDFTYTFDTVQMTADPIVYDDQTVDGFTFTDFTYTTRYPLGLDFTVKITPPPDFTEDIVSVSLMYRFAAGSQGRARAQEIDDGRWQAVPYDTRGLAPWMTMDVVWRVAYGETGVAETTPVHVQYIDPTRTWSRIESEDVIVYWYDFPDEFGEVLADAFVSVRDRFIQGFGDLLPFKPTVIIFPPGDAMGEFQAGGQINPRTTGQANGETYSAVLRVRGLEIEDIRTECIWNEPRDLEWQMRYAASVATHEVAHLYQYAYGSRGPAWWIEGEATFFELEMGPVDERLRHLVTVLDQDLATLQGQGPSGQVGTPALDGCTHLGYDMGASFINWLVTTHGGYATHLKIVELTAANTILDQAIERATGVPFSELEYQWRQYLGLTTEAYVPPTLGYQPPPSPTPFGQ